MSDYGSARPLIRGHRGSALSTAFLVVAGTMACAVLGFYIGRNVLGEQYLKFGAARIRSLPPPRVQARAPAEPPVIDEPATVAEPSEPERPRTRRSHSGTGSRNDQSRSTPSAPQDAGTVTLQLGSFLNSDNATNLVQDLRNRGYSPTVKLDKEGQTPVHRVEMGPLPPDRARELAADLQRQGYDVGVAEKRW